MLFLFYAFSSKARNNEDFYFHLKKSEGAEKNEPGKILLLIVFEIFTKDHNPKYA